MTAAATGPTVDEELVVEVGAPAAGGSCVGRGPDGRVVFVRHCLPGELVRARVTARTVSYLRADAIEILRPADGRVSPPCPHAGPGRCGGCDWQHASLPAQRSMKAALVAEQLRRLAGVTRRVEVEAVPAAEGEGADPVLVAGLGWRTRVAFAVAADGTAGLRRHRSHAIEAVADCLIAAPGVRSVDVPGRSWPGLSVVDVTASPDARQRVVSLTRRAGGAPGPALADLPDDVGVMVNGGPVRRPHGIRHDVQGFRFEVGAAAFWQVHPLAADTLATAVLDGLDPRPGDHVLDLYSGAGLFACLLGRVVGPTGTVLAVEGDPGAAADSARNSADLPWVRTRTATVDPELIRRRVGRPDLVVLDPPRAGAGVAVAAALAALRPRRLAYVACDPASFARDLNLLLTAGWSLTSLRAFDLFPMTEHVELVAILEPPG